MFFLRVFSSKTNNISPIVKKSLKTAIRGLMKGIKTLLLITLLTMMFSNVYAMETSDNVEVKKVNDIRKVTQYTEAACEGRYNINKTDSSKNPKKFRNISNPKKYFENNTQYVITDESKKEIEVQNIYGNKRIMVRADGEVDSYGAESAVYYDGEYIFTYPTIESTRKAYLELSKKYDAVLDVPMKLKAHGWGTEAMNLDFQSQKIPTSNKITVAVFDTGIDKNHPIFNDTVVSDKSWNFSNKEDLGGNPNYEDDHGHGTAVAGVIAESTPSNVEIVALKIFNSEGMGGYINVRLALDYIQTFDVDIVNMSFDFDMKETFDDLVAQDPEYDYMTEWETKYNQPIKEASDKGMYIVSASGNEGNNFEENFYFPSACPGVVPVGAVSKNDQGEYQLCGFSSYGDSIGFVAPGEDIEVAKYGTTEYRTSGGTSFACPYVASAAALVNAENPNMTNEQITSELATISKDLGEPGKDPYCGYGMPIFPTRKTHVSDVEINVSDTVYGSKPTITGLREGIDYEVTYDSLDVPEGSLIISGKGVYFGKRRIKFNVTPKSLPKYALNKKTFVYGTKPKITFKEKLIEGVDYKVTRQGSFGPVKVIAEGINNYTGKVQSTITVIPQKTYIKTLKKSKGKITVRINKVKSSGYQIVYSKKSSFKKAKKKFIKAKATIKMKGTNYIKIRAYKTVNGKKYYSDYSKPKKVSVK